MHNIDQDTYGIKNTLHPHELFGVLIEFQAHYWVLSNLQYGSFLALSTLASCSNQPNSGGKSIIVKKITNSNNKCSSNMSPVKMRLYRYSFSCTSCTSPSPFIHVHPLMFQFYLSLHLHPNFLLILMFSPLFIFFIRLFLATFISLFFVSSLYYLSTSFNPSSSSSSSSSATIHHASSSSSSSFIKDYMQTTCVSEFDLLYPRHISNIYLKCVVSVLFLKRKGKSLSLSASAEIPFPVLTRGLVLEKDSML